MGILENARHELVVQGILKGLEKEDNMTKAGLTYSPANYSRVKHLPLVQARLLELQKMATNENVMNLQERQELLTTFAQDVSETKNFRLKALAELHKQSGDDYNGVEGDGKFNNVIRHVEIYLPPKNNENLEGDVSEVIDVTPNKDLDDPFSDTLDDPTITTPLVEDLEDLEDLDDISVFEDV